MGGNGLAGARQTLPLTVGLLLLGRSASFFGLGDVAQRLGVLGGFEFLQPLLVEAGSALVTIEFRACSSRRAAAGSAESRSSSSESRARSWAICVFAAAARSRNSARFRCAQVSSRRLPGANFGLETSN